MAADAIHEAFETGDFSGRRLGAWGPDFYAGVQAIRKLVYAFYAQGFSFGDFNRRHPECRKTLVDLLIGDVFRPEVNSLFPILGRYCPLPEAMTLSRE